MPNPFFQFKQFTVYHNRCAMKVTTDGCLFGAWVAHEVQQQQNTSCLLDIGAGTGLLSLMVTQKNRCNIDAVEINPDAAKQANENIAASPWADRIQIIQDDLLQWTPPQPYDVIFSNPPFYQNDLKSPSASKNIAHHNNALKLEDLILFIKNHLSENGVFYLLLPAKREDEITSLFRTNDLYIAQWVQVQQTLKHSPFRLMVQGRKTKVETLLKTNLSIRNHVGDYSPEFISLLQDYYLYLSMAS